MEQIEKQTFIKHISFSLFNGLAFGVVLSLQEVIAKKALAATPTQITILFMSLSIARFSSILFTQIMQKYRNYRKFLIIAGIVQILSMSMIFFVNTAWAFIVLIWIFQIPQGIINPALNFIFSKNYDKNRRGKRVGIAISIMNLFALSASYGAGVILDINQQYFRPILFAVGLLAGLASFIIASISTPDREITPFENPFKNMVKIFRRNRAFWYFKRNFFIYGFAFLLIGPIIPMFLVDVLHMSYKEVAFSRGVLSMFGLVFLAPFSGKIYDRHNPFQFASKPFAFLALFPLLLLISASFGRFFAYSGFVIKSLTMAGVSIVWNLGSIFFSEHDQEATYQSIHITMTGIRGISAPLAGLISMTVLGYNWTFIISAVIFLTASAMMAYDAHKIQSA